MAKGDMQPNLKTDNEWQFYDLNLVLHATVN